MTHDFRYVWEWTLRSTPEQLWPYASDTQRFNRLAVGYSVKSLAEDDEGVQQIRARYFVPLAWDEHPFEWEAPRRFSVYRRFHGPILRDFISRVTLTPLERGTVLRYEVTAQAASLLGTIAIPIQIGLISRRRFARAFRRIDEFLQHPIEQSSPFQPAQVFVTGEATQRLREIGSELIRDGYDPDLIERLQYLTTHGAADEVIHLRPYALADQWRAPRRQVLELCLAATRRGLLDLRWDVVCPMCRGAKMSMPQLSDIREQARCPACRADFNVNFDHTLEVTFRPNAALRPVTVAEYCVGGPQLTPHIVAQQIIAAGEARTIEMASEPGAHRIRARSKLPHAVEGHFDLQIDAVPDEAARAVTIRASENGWSADRTVMATQAKLTLANQTAHPQIIVVERAAWSNQVVTAVDVSTVQGFRDWFAAQALQPNVQLGITHLAILFTDLRGSTQLYRSIGDTPAFQRVLEHFDVLRENVTAHSGALIKTIGDAIMAAFLDPVQGVMAALDILRSMDELNHARQDFPLRLKMGLHAGPAIAVTLNERLDYFGTTVNIASRLEGQAQGDDLILSAEVMRQAAVQRALAAANAHVEEFRAQLKGFVDEEFRLYRVRLS